LRNIIRYKFLALGLFVGLNVLQAQTKPGSPDFLQMSVTLDVEKLALDKIFDLLSKQCQCYFTYNARQINGNGLVTFQCTQWSLKRVLDTLLHNPAFSYEVIKNQVVIHPISIETNTLKAGIDNFMVIKGLLKNRITHEALPFASISVKSTYLGTMTNEGGAFQLKIPSRLITDTLIFSYLGYYNLECPISQFPEDGIIWLTEGTISIQEVIVRSKDPLYIIKKAREMVNENYQTQPYNYQAFYREAIKTDRKYSIYSEALMSGYKPQLKNASLEDKVQLVKARKFTNIQQNDTLMVKLRGGVDACFQLDIIRVMPEFLLKSGGQLYQFHLNDITLWQNELVYVIGFKQQNYIPEPLIEGLVYISAQNYAILGADFSFAPEKLQHSDKLFVIRKSVQTRVKPLQTHYTVKYTLISGKYYIQYVRGELELKVRKRKHLFNRNFSTLMEMVYTSIDTLNAERPSRKETFQTHTIFSDSEHIYDHGYWNQQNIIEPEENILDAFRKSGFQLQNEGITN